MSALKPVQLTYVIAGLRFSQKKGKELLLISVLEEKIFDKIENVGTLYCF